jgi:hypothetical protein
MNTVRAHGYHYRMVHVNLDRTCISILLVQSTLSYSISSIPFSPTDSIVLLKNEQTAMSENHFFTTPCIETHIMHVSIKCVNSNHV